MPEAADSGLFDRVRQTAAVLGLVLLAAAAVLSGSDRQSSEFPNSPSFVGWPYDTGAARASATRAFVRSGPASAIDYARRSILSDPISAQAVSILGRSELYAQRLADARAAFQVSGQLGWRDAMTQIYWLDQAMLAGDYKVASERLDALLRQFPDSEDRDRFLAVISASAEGRAALAGRLKLSPEWASRYLTDLANVPLDQLSQRVEVVQRVGPRIWTCDQVSLFVQRLIDVGALSQAQSVWRLNCNPGGSLLYDGDFSKLDTTKPTQGFEWMLPNRGDIVVQSIEYQPGDRLLEFKVEAAQSLPVLRQLVLLEPGRYRLTWRTPTTPPLTRPS